MRVKTSSPAGWAKAWIAALATLATPLVFHSGARAQATLENPGHGSAQSGVGLISGWSCNATSLGVRFDGGEIIPASYGTTRNDTIPVCGDGNNGFGLLYNYGLLSEGPHMVEVLDAGAPIAMSVFNVTRFAVPFLTGVAGSTLLRDFPSPGQSVTLVWQEALQAFTIAGRCDAPDSPPCPPTTSAAAYLWNNDPTPASTYTPSTTYQYSSTGDDGMVTRLSEGVYTVVFPNQGGDSAYRGVAQVTAYGSEPRFCKPSTGWGPSGADMVVTVYCFDVMGDPVDAQFAILWTRPGTDSTDFAFVDKADDTDGLTFPHHQFNSAGATSYVQTYGPDSSLVFFPGHYPWGVVKVSSTSTAANRCDVYGLYPDGETGFKRVDVRCVDAAGAPVSTTFAISYAHEGTIAPGVPGGSSYLLAGAPTEPLYMASFDTHYNSAGGVATIQRVDVGYYRVVLPGLGTPSGNAQVSAHGELLPNLCTVGQWNTTGSDELVDVRCFDGAGAPKDSKFLLSFVQ